MYARIIINDVITDGKYSKSFLCKLYKMGATITVFVDGLTINMEEDYDYIKNHI